MGLDLLLGSFPQHAQVAQLVEHATENRSVGGSIPPLGTIPLILPDLLARMAEIIISVGDAALARRGGISLYAPGHG